MNTRLFDILEEYIDAKIEYHTEYQYGDSEGYIGYVSDATKKLLKLTTNKLKVELRLLDEHRHASEI